MDPSPPPDWKPRIELKIAITPDGLKRQVERIDPVNSK